jgi:GT2 family glycosyltransferase
MSKKYHISIGIPVKIADGYAELAIMSALEAQKECTKYSLNCEVLIISADINICRIFPFVTCIHHPPTGIYPAFNHLVAYAKGSYTLILAADDLITDPKILAKIIHELFSPNSPLYSAEVVVSPMLIGNYPHNSKLIEPSTSLFKNLRRQSINHPGMIISSSVYAKVGHYLCSIGPEADYEFCLRLIKAKVALYKTYSPYVFHRLGGVSSDPSKNRLYSHLRCIRSIYSLYPLFILLAVPIRSLSFLIGSFRILFVNYLR